MNMHCGYYVTKDDMNRTPAWYSKVGWTCCGEKKLNGPCGGAVMKPDDIFDQEKVDKARESLCNYQETWKPIPSMLKFKRKKNAPH